MSYIHWLREKVGHEPIFFNVSCALIVNLEGKILLQRRSGTKEEVWGIPGGGLEIGESAEEAMRREVLEETGLEVEVQKFLGVYTADNILTYPNGDICHMIVFIFVCRPAGGTPKIDNGETLELKYFDARALPKLFGKQIHQAIQDYEAGISGIVR